MQGRRRIEESIELFKSLVSMRIWKFRKAIAAAVFVVLTAVCVAPATAQVPKSESPTFVQKCLEKINSGGKSTHLHKGYTGSPDCVRFLQKMLNRANYYVGGPWVSVDGSFGDKTANAVAYYQQHAGDVPLYYIDASQRVRTNNITPVDGWAGPNTFTRLANDYPRLHAPGPTLANG